MGKCSLLIEVNNLIERIATEHARLRQVAEGQSTSSSRSSSFDSFISEDAGEQVASEVRG